MRSVKRFSILSFKVSMKNYLWLCITVTCKEQGCGKLKNEIVSTYLTKTRFAR